MSIRHAIEAWLTDYPLPQKNATLSSEPFVLKIVRYSDALYAPVLVCLAAQWASVVAQVAAVMCGAIIRFFSSRN